MFPKVTYDWEEFIEFNDRNEELREHINEGCYAGWYSEYGKGCIWLNEPSIITILHEFLHHVGFKLNLPRIWHHMIERIL